ncbi:hypothetical protein OH76DRAFT_1408556 [Lentinus brumalis]|uniref:Pheromone n=1 Tax=Lentinus brumalis TaxID=2498619 RepID=A0A371CXE3_9APHY|nr:hypothetical protein OH76DRAFT_1408556 [Polyporus brumalis]
MDAFAFIDFLGPEAAPPLPADLLPSSSADFESDSAVPTDFEYINNNYSHSWCTIA